MKRFAALAFTLLLVHPPLAAQVERTRNFISHVEESMPGLLERYEVPVADVAVLEQARVPWEGEFTLDTPALRGQRFHVASLSKTATALAFLSLAERRDVDLDRPVDRYLKRWQVPDSRFDEGDVTARRLLNHTAGFPFGAPDAPRAGVPRPPIVDVLEGEGGVEAKLTTRPGSKFNYSNIGYGVLELVLEEVTGKKYADAMRDLVFEPLEMKDTGFEDDPQQSDAGVRPGFYRAGRPAEPDVRVLRAAGGMISSASDIARLLNAASVPKDDGGLLEPASLVEMWRYPRAGEGAFGLGKGAGYGLGIATAKLPSGKRFVANNGSHEDYNALMLSVPEDRAGFVVLTNSATGLGVELELALDWFERVAKEKPAFARRFESFRGGLRVFTFLLIAICVAYLVWVFIGVRNERRVRTGPRLRSVLLKAVPLTLPAVLLVAVFNTGLLTQPMGGISPERFISDDYGTAIWVLAALLLQVAVVAVLLPKQRINPEPSVASTP